MTTTTDAMRDAKAAGKVASSDIQDDLQTLRDDVSNLGRKAGDILANTGNAALKHAKTSFDSVMSDANVKGREAADAMRDVSDSLVGAIDDSLARRPYTTLAIALGVGFVFGAMMRR